MTRRRVKVGGLDVSLEMVFHKVSVSQNKNGGKRSQPRAKQRVARAEVGQGAHSSQKVVGPEESVVPQNPER